MHAAVHELKKRLQERYGDRLCRFLVFGSYARGDNAPDSDIDIFVTLEGKVDRQTENEIFDMYFPIELENDVVLDVKIFSEEDIQNTVLGAIPLVENVLSEGVPL